MKEKMQLTETFNVEPSIIFAAWLDSDLHSMMTGGEAECSSEIGDSFSAWDGYITGENIELVKDQKIVQTWRTSEFSENDEDSILIIELKKSKEGTELMLSHTNIPQGQTQYKKGWKEHYFTPMKAYFNK